MGNLTIKFNSIKFNSLGWLFKAANTQMNISYKQSLFIFVHEKEIISDVFCINYTKYVYIQYGHHRCPFWIIVLCLAIPKYHF